MEVPAFVKNMVISMLEQDSFRLPGVIQSQLTSWAQKTALEKLDLRTAISPCEVTTRRLADGRNAAHLSVDITLSKLDLARLAEKKILEKTGIPVTVRIRSLTVEDRSPAVSGAHLNAEVAFDGKALVDRL